MQPIRLPDLGENVTHVLVVKWLKHIGDPVSVDEPILEVVTDKVNIDISSDVEGILVEYCVGEGDTVPVDAIIALVEKEESGR